MIRICVRNYTLMLSKQIFGLVLPAVVCAGATLAAAALPSSGLAGTQRNVQAEQAFAEIPGWFEPAAHGTYISRGHAGDVALTPGGVNMAVRTDDGARRRVLPVSLRGARQLNWTGEKRLAGVTSYFLGNDQAKWQAGIPQYASVRAAAWKGVDLVVYGRQKHLEYDFVVAPGADARRIGMQFGQGWQARLQASGDLEISDGVAKVRQQKPVAWQQIAGRRVEVESRFRLDSDGSVGFEVGSYDRTKELVIDPVLAFSGYFGGSSDDEIVSVGQSPDGTYWLCGTTGSTIPSVTGTTPYLSARAGFKDIFLAQLRVASDGTPQVSYFSYIGGSSDDIAEAMAISPSGKIAVVGKTGSTAFPTTTYAFQSTLGGGGDAFVLEFDPSQGGTAAMLFSSFFGGTSPEVATGVAFDSNEKIVVSGWTNGSALPEAGSIAAYSTTSFGGTDIFVLKVDPAGTATTSTLLYSSFVGGNLTDVPNAMVVDSNDRIYIGGMTASASLPNVGSPYSTFLHGGADAFLLVLDLSRATTQQLVYSSYLGGENLDALTALALDGKGGIWLTGYTLSPDFPTTQGAIQRAFTGYAATWLSHLDLTKGGFDSMTYSTLFNGAISSYGGFEMTMPYAVVLDSAGRPTIGGYTNCLDLPEVAKLPITQPTIQLSAFLATIDPAISGNAGLVFSTLFGGGGASQVTALAKDSAGNILVGGVTSTNSFPVTDGSTKLSPVGAPSSFYLLIKPDAQAVNQVHAARRAVVHTH
jgi:hypothetical protein